MLLTEDLLYFVTYYLVFQFVFCSFPYGEHNIDTIPGPIRYIFPWKLLDHPLNSPELAVSDIYLLPSLKEFLGGKHLENDDMLIEIDYNWFNSPATEFFDDELQKLQYLPLCLWVNGKMKLDQ